MEHQAGYQKLIVWQKADEFTLLLYKETYMFPKQEMYNLTSQLRRAGLSIPTNIVEGYARNSKNEFKRFLAISLGSLAEVKYLLSVAHRLGYFKEDVYAQLTDKAEAVGQLLWKFYKSF